MVQYDIPGVREAPGGSGVRQGARGGARGVYATPGGKKSDKNSKKNGPKPRFKVSKVYPDPKRMVLIHF